MVVVLGLVLVSVSPFVVLSAPCGKTIGVIDDYYSNYFPLNDPPSWATCGFIGVLGVTDQLGKPVTPPLQVVAGYCADHFNGQFIGAIYEFNETERSGYLAGRTIRLFMMAVMGNSSKEQWHPFVGIGGSNETHFYFRMMTIVGPTMYLAGTYKPL